ncbi:hypothetical protein K3148_01930 [Qipengyuania aurantiaca]|uniref:DUF2231 domain-containing protein n=1 Tax=Qipengyuania aurantiaca TaxID=2867233 RepID=A0ABX8ZMI9_9SPHN|nr:DUF2231 domain-containing protein [Qipengyuania aurantiaca]QZD90190.1 hypothetical protein K3148_01930 [Qipengyuania aurantiaca]
MTKSATLLLLAALALLVQPAALYAHGPEPHEEEKPEAVEVEAAPAQDASPNATAAEPSQSAPAAPSPRYANLLNNLHPATVHFPIALLLFAALAELLFAARGSERMRHTAQISAAAGGITAGVAALFGWIHTGIWLGGDGAMQWHRWLGTGLGIAGPFIAWIALSAGERRNLLRALLALAAITVLAQGWLGAELGHGAGHLWA